MSIFYYLVLGCVAGTLAGLLGIGGGLIIVPALIYIFSQQGIAPEMLTHMAVGTSLATIVFTSISSVRMHHVHGAVQWRLFQRLVLGIIIGSLAGAWVADSLQGVVLQLFIGVFALMVSFQMGFGLQPVERKALPGNIGLMWSGVGIGAISTLFGIGGGSVTVPLLTRFSVPIRHAVATSSACGLPIAVVGALGFVVTGWAQPNLPEYSLGYLYLPAVAGIVLSSVVFAGLGARLAHHLPAATLKKVFALLLFFVACQLLAGVF